MVYVPFEERLHRLDDPPAADNGAIDIVMDFILDDEANRPPFPIATARRLLLHLMIGPGDRPQEIDLFRVKQTPGDEESVGMKPGNLVGGGRESAHAITVHQCF
jgi:hypothetical protein